MNKLVPVSGLALLLVLVSLSMPAQSATAQAGVLSPRVFTISHYDTSLPLQTLQAAPAPPPARRNLPRLSRIPLNLREGTSVDVADEALDTSEYEPNIPAPLDGWNGINFDQSPCNCLPPDPNGDVGLNHYVQTVNTALQVWNKKGKSLLGPIPNNTLFSGFGGACETTNDGDPIVLYDPIANRWFFSQFALPTYPTPPFYQCIAVSTASDPTGSWYRYEFEYPNGFLNDYAKWGVWRDAYYMTANQFDAQTEDWKGTGVLAFERDKMLQGQAPRVVYFNLGVTDWGGMLPSDIDGEPPPNGTPNYFVEIQEHDWDPINIPRDRVMVWRFDVNWDHPKQSMFTNIAKLGSKKFNGNLCNLQRGCIPQPGNAPRLDAIAGVTMFRLAYRDFGDHASLVTNLSVDAGDGRAGVRWYELRIVNGVPSIYQQSTFAAGKSLERWLGSAAMDRRGNLALGFSAASEDQYPSIRYAGRLAKDPLNKLARGSKIMKAGTGAQLSFQSRWGDYSMLAVDPADDCTFWYTNEYYSSTSQANWKTWIGKFKFNNCS